MEKSTTYTVIKRLAEKGILQNDTGTITSLVSKEAAQAYEIDELTTELSSMTTPMAPAMSSPTG